MTKENEARIHWHKICDELNVLNGIRIGVHQDNYLLSSTLGNIEKTITNELIALMQVMKIDTKYK